MRSPSEKTHFCRALALGIYLAKEPLSARFWPSDCVRTDSAHAEVVVCCCGVDGVVVGAGPRSRNCTNGQPGTLACLQAKDNDVADVEDGEDVVGGDGDKKTMVVMVTAEMLEIMSLQTAY